MPRARLLAVALLVVNNDRYRLGSCLCRLGRRLATGCSEHRDLPADEIGCQLRQSIVVSVRPPILEKRRGGFPRIWPSCWRKG